MAQHWLEKQLNKITPPQVRDERGRAVLRSLNELIGDAPAGGLFMRDPATCPAALLPALIAEMSMGEFIDPSLPEHVQRRILKKAFLLQSSEGTDAGVELGLSLLGMRGHVEQWWQVEPKRKPNTHRIYFYVEENLFPGEAGHLSERTSRAALRMIDATKRFSQGSEIFVGARLKLPTLRAASRVSVGASMVRARMTIGQQAPRVRVGLRSAAAVNNLPVKAHRLTLKGAK